MWRISKAMVRGEPTYLLAKLGGKHPVLVCAGTLDEAKAAASAGMTEPATHPC